MVKCIFGLFINQFKSLNSDGKVHVNCRYIRTELLELV